MEVNNWQPVQSIKEKDPIKILAVRIYMINVNNGNYFIYYIQFNIKKSETYIKIMQSVNVSQRLQIIIKESDQLHKNNT